MAFSSSTATDQEPLFQRSHSPTDSIVSSNSISKSRIDDEKVPFGNINHLDRSVENDVLPETAVLGRNLGWSSAYILIMSRVIGSGIFATPGAIVRSVGSVGITLLLWIAGALISWLGLAISLEYGCMLPRSGGERSSVILTSDGTDGIKGIRSISSSSTDTPDFWLLFLSRSSPYFLDLQPPTVLCSANTSYTL